MENGKEVTKNEKIAEEMTSQMTGAKMSDFLKELYNAVKVLKPQNESLSADQKFGEATIGEYTEKKVDPKYHEIFLDTARKLEAENPLAAEQLRGIAGTFRLAIEGSFEPDAFAEYYTNHDESEELQILNIGWGKYHLTLPKGSFNVIGARPGNGKTTALISIAQEQLRERLRIDRQESGEEKPKVDGIVFVSLEEPEREIYRKLIASYICGNLEADKIDIDTLSENTRADVFRFYKDRMPEGQTFRDNFDKAQREIYELTKEGKLTIFGEDKRNIGDLKKVISFYKNHLILLDYVQMVKPSDKGSAAYKEIQEVCDEIALATKESDSIVITGAQLNREALGKNGDEFPKPEKLNGGIYREGDDILTYANVAIAIERADKESLYWKIIKNRNGGGVYESGNFKSRLDYSFLKATGEKVITKNTGGGINRTPIAPKDVEAV